MKPWGEDRDDRTGWTLRVEAGLLLALSLAGIGSMVAWALN